MLALLRLLELCFEEFAQQVDTEYALPCPQPDSLMEYVDAVADALDEYLLGDEELTSVGLDLLDNSGLLCTVLLLQRESSLLACDYYDDCNS